MQVYFITGTSRGIGKQLAERILEEADTWVYGFSREQSIEHERYEHHAIDLSDVTALKTKLSGFFADFPEASRFVLINNAGTLGDVAHLGSIDDASMIHLFNLNVTAPALLMNHFIKKYEKYKAEKMIVNVSSGAGKSPVDGWSGYCASKAAVDMLSQVADQEMKVAEKQGKNRGFRVFSLAPGVVDTAMQTAIRQTDPAGFSNIEHFINLKEEGQLDDAKQAAEKFLYLIDHADAFENVLQDVRHF